MDDAAHEDLQRAAKDHLWLHFAKHGAFRDAEMPVMERGEGAYLYDTRGRRYLDGLSGLFTSQLGHGRTEIADAAAAQARELAFMPLWGYAHPTAIRLAERLAAYAPGDLQRVFFTSGGSEAVESAWKLAKNYFKAVGKPLKHKVVSRSVAYHGTTQGALSITGVPMLKQQFEPLVPSTSRAPNTNLFRAAELTGGLLDGSDPEAFGRWAADQVRVAIEAEGPETVAAVFLEPVQNAGGCLAPPPGYFERVREICDEHDVLLVSDEVICGFGRLGHVFAAERYGYVPDIITCAKGITSGYAPLGAMVASERLMEPFLADGATFAHGYTFGGHPMSTAVGLASLDVIEREGVLDHVLANQDAFRSTLERLLDLPIVGDVRGEGYFYAVELVKEPDSRTPFTRAESTPLLMGVITPALLEEGLYCRADNRGDAVVQVAPPLTCDQSHFDEMEHALRVVLDKVGSTL